MNSPRMLLLTLAATLLALGMNGGAQERDFADVPAWAHGWVVASVTIPVDGDLKDALVDFQMPDGEPVTLHAGAQSKGGPALESIAWEGTPVRARVRLRQGRQTADLFAAAALVAKSKVQKKRAGHVEVEGRFIEVPEALALTLRDPTGQLLFPPVAKGGKARADGQIVGMLTEAQVQPFLAELSKTKGVDLLSAPRVTTRVGQRAVIEVIRELVYPVEWDRDAALPGLWIPSAFETRNVGVTLEIKPNVGVDEVLELGLIPQVVGYLGAVDVDTGKAFPAPPDERKPFEEGRKKLCLPDAFGRRLRPVFSTQKANVSVSMRPGSTVVFAGFGEAEEIKPFKPKKPGRRLLVIVTARQIPAP